MFSTIKKLCVLGVVAVVCAGGTGCMYAGIATTPDGTLYVARNDLFLAGLLRKMYVCKPAGEKLACTETSAP